MRSKVYITVALIAGILIMLNLVANEFHLRIDLTEDKQYTLSEATRDILNDLEEPVTVKAYFSEDLPPHILKTRRDFQEMLVEYAHAADGLIHYEFVNPNEKEQYEQEAMQQGIQPVLINVREKDQVKQQKAFLGATVSLGEEQEVIPLIQPGAAMEYSLSTAIKKLSLTDKPVVGFLQGHGEPMLAEMAQVNEQLSVLYETRAVTLTDSARIDDAIKTLAIVRPQDSIPPAHLQQIDEFLARGGRLVVAINRVHGDLQTAYGSAVNTGLEDWLRKKGVEVKSNFIVDAQCGAVMVQQHQGFFTLQTNVSFPYLPVISNFADHPITSGLESVILQFASTINYIGDSTSTFTPLAFTSELSNALDAPQFFDIEKRWTEADFTQKNLVVAAALERRGPENGTPSRIVIIADGDFPVNGMGQRAQRLEPDNVSLLSNAIDWLSDDTGLIALRTKSVTSRPIKELDETTKIVLKYANFLLPVLLAIGYGVMRAQKNRMKRFKRMSENYEN